MAEEGADKPGSDGAGNRDIKGMVRDTLRDADRVQALRERLYAREVPPKARERHSFERPAAPGNTEQPPTGTPVRTPNTVRTVTPPPAQTPHNSGTVNGMGMVRSRRRSYRIWMILIGLGFFCVSLAIASFFLMQGNNTVGNNKIGITVSGPITVGGGEDLSLQVAVANQNEVPIESATLIVQYPNGTQSIRDVGRPLNTERQQLNNIAPNEVVNVPLKVRMFGEENEEKTISITVEYRIAGSNGTFTKTADPFIFRISTSPVRVSIDGVETTPSGQEITFDVVVESNATTPLDDLLVTVGYPSGFDVLSVEPEPVADQDTWRITRLKTGEKRTITISGVLTGSEKDRSSFEVAVGVPDERDPFRLSSQLAVATHEVEIERPFLAVDVAVNGKKDDVIVVVPREDIQVGISFTNVLETALYAGRISVQLGGNALDEVSVDVRDGYYDSSSNTVVWDQTTLPQLAEIQPGKSSELSFRLRTRTDIMETPTVTLNVSLETKRLFDDAANERITGSVEKTVKVETVPEFTSSVLYSDGPFTNTGPTPPVAESTTQYTLLFTVTNSTNAISGGEVTAVLPPFVTWLDRVSEGDRVTYNGSTRTMTWDVGDIPANGYAEAWAQVSFTPSKPQVDTIPTILQSQRFKGEDQFTGTVIRDEAPALTTDLRDDPNPEIRDGRVRLGE